MSLRISRLSPVLGIGTAFAILTLTAAGCGSRGAPVSGEVVEDGRPVEFGFVQFSHDAKKGTNGPAVIMDINEGKFTNATERVPVMPGEHCLRIVVPVVRPNQEAIPREYLTQASVPTTGAADLRFKVSSKSPKGQR